MKKKMNEVLWKSAVEGVDAVLTYKDCLILVVEAIVGICTISVGLCYAWWKLVDFIDDRWDSITGWFKRVFRRKEKRD